MAGSKVVVGLAGEEEMPISWPTFVKRAEDSAEVLLPWEDELLHDAMTMIDELHRAYVPGRWTDSPEALLAELSLKMVAFYLDGSAHLWYQGSEVFNHLDVDIGLDVELRVEDVRFDG